MAGSARNHAFAMPFKYKGKAFYIVQCNSPNELFNLAVRRKLSNRHTDASATLIICLTYALFLLGKQGFKFLFLISVHDARCRTNTNIAILMCFNQLCLTCLRTHNNLVRSFRSRWHTVATTTIPISHNQL